jgi:hypothetical protein
MFAGIRFADAIYDGCNGLIFGWRRENNRTPTGLKVLLQVRALGEDTGALEDKLYAVLAPGDLGRVFLVEYGVLIVIDDDLPFVMADVMGIATVDSVVLEQVSKVIGGYQIVDRYQVEPGGLVDNLKGSSSDSTKSIDSNAHYFLLSTPSSNWGRIILFV